MAASSPIENYHNTRPPFLVLVAGPTCAGKSRVAHAVRNLLPPRACQVIAIDWYYRDLSRFDAVTRAAYNFDHPGAIDWELLERDVYALRAGRAIAAPTYDYVSHVRGRDTRIVESARILLVEGVLALHHEGLNAAAGLRVYLDSDDGTCLARRIARDAAERGRTEPSVRDQFMATVLPMAQEYVRPTRERADLVLDGREPVASLARRVCDRIPPEYR